MTPTTEMIVSAIKRHEANPRFIEFFVYEEYGVAFINDDIQFTHFHTDTLNRNLTPLIAAIHFHQKGQVL